MIPDSPYTMYKALLPRIAALGEEMARNARTKPLSLVPMGVTRLAARLLRDTRRLTGDNFRIPRNAELTFAELSVLLGQARAALEAYGERHGLNTSHDPRYEGELENIKRKLAERLEYIRSREQALREIEEERARQGLPPLVPESDGGI